MTKPRRVDNVECYWTEPPPVRSDRCCYWVARIKDGWRPNRRVSAMGYHEATEFFGVHIWEYIHVLSPLLAAQDERANIEPEG